MSLSNIFCSGNYYVKIDAGNLDYANSGDSCLWDFGNAVIIDGTQGWVKKIENDRFVQELSYAPGCYNGNVSSNLWGDKAGTTRRYDYTYDKLNRLTSAVYVEPSRVEPPGVILDAGPDYSAYYSYDLNGNILTLSRAGIWDKTSINDNDQLWCYELIDDMEFHYDGNRLMKIDDYGSDGIFEEAPGFIDGNTDGNDYTWNGNGSMTSDLNTGITRITYNDINLPHFVTFNNGHQTVYVYSCDGRKLQATYQVAVTATTSGASTYARYRTEMIKKYSGEYIYENDTLTTILFDGGYIDMRVGLPLYHFYTHDYQGNIRVSEDISGNKIERYDYYPYGALFGESSPSQDYLYGGKEWERTYGMNHYDFHARWMNPLTTRFTTQDPLQLDYAGLSSYSYCAGNPVLYIDPTGEKILLPKGTSTENVYTVLGNLQKLTNDKLVYRTQEDGTIRIKIASLGEGNKIAGTNLVRQLNSSSKTMTINIETKDGNKIEYKRKSVINGEGRDVNVYFNPNADPKILTKSAKGKVNKEGRPAQIGLSHELIHGIRAMNGDAIEYKKETDYNYINQNGIKTTKNALVEELETIGIKGNYHITENKIRKEQKQNIRISY